MILRFRRLSALVRPASYLKEVVQRRHTPKYGPQEKNFFLKSKLLLIIGLVFFASNLLLSRSSIFTVDNYNISVGLTEQLGRYLSLDRNLFRTDSFLGQFRLFTPKNGFYTDLEKSILGDASKVEGSSSITGHYFNRSYAPAAYLNHVRRIYETEKDPQIYFEQNPLSFHWADWVDISQAKPFADSYDDIVEKYFDGNPVKLQRKIQKICYAKMYDNRDLKNIKDIFDEEAGSWGAKMLDIGLCAAIFKYYYWPIPERILFETDYEYFKLPFKEKRPENPIGLEGLSEIYHGKDQVKSSEIEEFVHNYDVSKTTNELIEITKRKKIIPEREISLQTEIKQDPQDFKRPNFQELLKRYREIENPTKEEKKYLNFLEYSDKNIKNYAVFYFRFPWLNIDTNIELHHYTFTWFKQILSHEERIKVVHHLIRSWFKLAERHNIISWFNYGNLIGWYFNSMNLPWDNDVDVQMSIKDLDFIGRYLNNTLIQEDPKYGDSLFWLQTNPFYMEQNDAQFIDARYIDVNSGIYIDISALWEDDASKPEHLKLQEGEIGMHCKHYNWFGYNEIFPIKRTLYEGSQAYMVNDPIANMRKLYGDKPLTQRNEMNYNWQEDLGLWVRNEVCETGNNVPATKERFDENGELTLFGACNNTELLELWQNTKEARKISVKERALMNNNESTVELTGKSLPVYRHFDYEQFR